MDAATRPTIRTDHPRDRLVHEREYEPGGGLGPSARHAQGPEPGGAALVLEWLRSPWAASRPVKRPRGASPLPRPGRLVAHSCEVYETSFRVGTHELEAHAITYVEPGCTVLDAALDRGI